MQRVRVLSVAAVALVLQSAAFAQTPTPAPDDSAAVLHVYGPGGPAPAMREAAQVFGDKHGIKVDVVAGPTPKWKDQAMANADLIYSGAEHMMTDFVQKDLPGLIDTATIRTMYLRASAILVRPGNPKRIKGVKDLAKPGIRVLAVQGAGQTGMWEDVAGRTGDVKLVDAVRRNIGLVSPNSGEAKQTWNSDPSYDAWLIWTIWQKENPAAADLVKIERQNTIYRSTGIAITQHTPNKAMATRFADFLQSAEGQKIFVKWGWEAP